MDQQSILLLGTRGSMPACGAAYTEYGGDTACVLARMGTHTILLDAGSGLTKAMGHIPPGTDHISILVSHTHIDHILGLPGFDFLYGPGNRVDIYGAARDGMGIEEQIRAFLSPPLWPAGAEAFKADIRYHAPAADFAVGGVRVRTMEGNHPGGATVYRLDHGGGSAVYCTDFEHGGRGTDELAAFARDCGALVYDAHFTGEEYPGKRGWGHSTGEAGAALGARCGAKKVVLFHHHPQRADGELERMDREIRRRYPGCGYGKAGEEVVL